jgi:hypothetical protein
MVLVAATIFIALALLTVAALSARYLQQRLDTDAYQNYNRTFDALDAALTAARKQLQGTVGTGIIGLAGWTPVYNSKKELVLPDFSASLSHPVSLPASPDDGPSGPPQYLAYSVNWGSDGRDNNGNGAVDETIEKTLRSIHVAAKYRGVTRRAEAVYTYTKVSMWDNAIFAGAGSAGGAVRGNVSIHGSVNILGDGLLAGGVAMADAIDFNGTSLIRNNYIDLSQNLSQRIPALPTIKVGNTQQSTLNAKLRVRHGLVGLNGNSMIGQPYLKNNTSKLKTFMDGTYVTDGWTGNKTTPDGGRGTPSSVYSDNGWGQSYDMGDEIAFPLLSAAYRDPASGNPIYKSGTVPYTHEEYFTEVLVGSPTNPTDGIYNGDINLNLAGTGFYWNATTNTKLVGSQATSAKPNATDDYIQFDPVKTTLAMNGQIKINGKLAFSGAGNTDSINYTGRCAIMTTGDVNIDVSLLSCNKGNVNNVGNSFPVANCLGIMSKGNVYLGANQGASQLEIMGAFYAQNSILDYKQTSVVGTFVSNFFDMTNQVPNIFQVPTLSANLPAGMIGDSPILTLSQMSWRELGLS